MKKKIDLLSEKMISLLTRKFNIKTYDELSGVIEEALMNYYNISLQEINENRTYINLDEEDITRINYENYVYVYMDPRFYNEQGWILFEDKICHYLPFYVGKGRNNRSHTHLKCSQNSEMALKLDELNKIKIKPEIEIIHSDLTNLMAYNLESSVIALLRKQNIKLCNLTNQIDPSNYDNKNFTITTNFLEKKKNVLILKVLNASKTLGEAAKILGISERTLYRKIKDLKIIKTKKGIKNYSYEFSLQFMNQMN